jgi:cytochrome c peroxidase
MKRGLTFFLFMLFIIAFKSCKKDVEILNYTPTPYNLVIPAGLPPMPIPIDNPLTVEGVELGRRLFYDELLSGNNTMSCATCHHPSLNFTDTARFSTGITGAVGTRNSMPLINLGWQTSFFWDGRNNTLEEQVLHPVINPIEMNDLWPNVVWELMQDEKYPEMFRRAFGERGIDSVKVSKALAQFLRIMISGNSKYDKMRRNELVFTTDELLGMELFNRDKDEANNIAGADCFHCHGEPMFTSNQFHNNGLDAIFTDLGRGFFTNNPNDNGKFKAPSLRNIALTAPYMHDGRFETLDDVIDHYSTGLVYSTTIDPLMKFVADGGVALTTVEKNQLKAFLNTLTDNDFAVNPAFQDPEN